MTQDEHESEGNDPGRKNKRTVGETDVNEKIGETARISRCRNKTNNISPSEWYRRHRETNPAKKKKKKKKNRGKWKANSPQARWSTY